VTLDFVEIMQSNMS